MPDHHKDLASFEKKFFKALKDVEKAHRNEMAARARAEAALNAYEKAVNNIYKDYMGEAQSMAEFEETD